VERAPDSDDAHTGLAKLLRDNGRAAEGAEMLAAYTSSHVSAGASAWAWLGLLRDDAEDWKAGETAHRQALALAPGRDDLHNNLGYCLLRQGRREEAATEFRAALKLHPHSAIAENNLALALAVGSKVDGKAGNRDNDAVAHLQSVTDPASAHNNLAVAYIEAGRYAEAHKEIETALRYNRTHSAALNNLRLLSELEGRPAEIQAPVHAEGPAGNSADHAADRRGMWARVVSAWHHFRGSSVPDGRTTNDSNATVASR
jgi:Flp pilus assembly protein TadD